MRYFKKPLCNFDFCQLVQEYRCTTHLAVEDAGGVGRNIFQLIDHRVKGDLAGRLLVHNRHPEVLLLLISHIDASIFILKRSILCSDCNILNFLV